jgi:hypothetical protein
VVEYLLSLLEAMGSIPGTTKRKEKIKTPLCRILNKRWMFVYDANNILSSTQFTAVCNIGQEWLLLR